MKFDNQIPPLARKILFNLDAEENHTAWTIPLIINCLQATGISGSSSFPTTSVINLSLFEPFPAASKSAPNRAVPSLNTTQPRLLYFSFPFRAESQRLVYWSSSYFFGLWFSISHFKLCSSPKEPQKTTLVKLTGYLQLRQSHPVLSTRLLPRLPSSVLSRAGPFLLPRILVSLSFLGPMLPGVWPIRWLYLLWLRYCPLRGSV